MKERILFPVDLSEGSSKIVHEVILMAEKFDAEMKSTFCLYPVVSQI